MTPLFTVCLIARNEEEHLPRLLKSLEKFRELKGKIILVDTGSTDDTCKIARDAGCEVHELGSQFIKEVTQQEANIINSLFNKEADDVPLLVKSGDKLFDFAQARNFTTKLSDKDYVLMPDCDEVLTKLDIAEINDLIQKGYDKISCPFNYSYDEYGNPKTSFNITKLFNRNNLHWVGNIHEVLTGSKNPITVHSDVMQIDHYQNEKSNREGYLKGLAYNCYINYPNTHNDRNLFYFGRELAGAGRYKSAIPVLLKHASIGTWAPEKSQSLLYVGDCYFKLGDEPRALQVWQEGYYTDPTRRSCLLRLSQFFHVKANREKNDSPDKLRYYQISKQYAETAMTIPWQDAYINNRAEYQHIPHEYLYIAYWWLGDKAKGKEHWQKAISFRPNHSKYILDRRFFD